MAKQYYRRRDRHWRETITYANHPALSRIRHMDLQLVKSKYGFRCLRCGATEDDGVVLTVDHVVPLSFGGCDDPSNWQLLCYDCNRWKGRQILDFRGEYKDG